MSQPKAGDDPRSPNNVLFRTAILGSSIKGDLRVWDANVNAPKYLQWFLVWLMLEEIKDSDKALKKQLDASEQEALIEFLAQQHPVGEA